MGSLGGFSVDIPAKRDGLGTDAKTKWPRGHRPGNPVPVPG
jgi:hypothetical protein